MYGAAGTPCGTDYGRVDVRVCRIFLFVSAAASFSAGDESQTAA
jgi:hypothetical protein